MLFVVFSVALALLHCRLDAIAGAPPGQTDFDAGVALLNGNGVEKDERAALVNLRRAADAGDAQAEDIAGELLARGTHPSESRAKSLQAEMQVILARYKQGHVELANVQRITSLSAELAAVRDPDAAMDYFRKAVAAGLPAASRHLGDLLLSGDGVARDLHGAREQYELAANRGDAVAAHVLGAMREVGLGGPVDLAGAQQSYSVAAGRGERRAALFVAGFADASGWPKEQTLLDAAGKPGAAPILRPELAASGRKLVLLAQASVAVADTSGRRRFHGELKPGAELALADDDASLDIIASTPTLRPDLDADTTFGELVRPGGSEFIKGRFHVAMRLLPETHSPSWTVSPHGCDVRIFTADDALSLPARFVPLQTMPGDVGPVEAPDVPELYLELRPGCAVDVKSPDGSRWAARAPQGVTLRTKLVHGPRQNWFPATPPAESLPSELGADAETGAVVSRDNRGRANGWALRADDYRQPTVISTWLLNLAVAAFQTSVTGDPTAALRSVTIFHSANLQLYGPQSAEALNSGISLARSLASAGRTAEALQQADHWSFVSERIFGPQGDAAAAAHLLRASVETANGNLPLAEADARRAVVASPMLLADTPPLGDKAAWKKLLGTTLARPGGNVDTRYVNALSLLADLYASAGETTRERAVLRRELVLETVNDPEGRENGQIPILLRLARLSAPGAPAASRALAEYAKRLAKSDALLRDVPEPLPQTIPPVPPFFRHVFGNPEMSMTYSNALRELGDAYVTLGDPGDASAVLQAAASIASRATGPGSPASARINALMAENSLKRADVKRAVDLARTAYAIDIRTRNESLSVDGSAGLALAARESADLLLRALATEGSGADSIPEAYEVLSQVTGGDLGQAVNLSSRPEASATAARLAAAKRELQAAVIRNDEVASAELRKQADLLSSQLSSLVPQRGGAGLSRMTARLGSDGALLVLWPGRTETFVLAIGPGGRKLVTVKGGTDALRILVARYRSQLTNLEVPFDAGSAEAIYDRMFKPVETELSGAKRMLVISDGFLRGVPLESLRSGDRWLSDDRQVDYLPGFADPAAAGPRDAARPALFAVADPIVPGGSTEDTPLARILKWIWRDRLVPLPDTAAEIESIRRALSGDPADLLVREQATEQQIYANPDFAKAKVVVFATHGLAAGNALEPNGLPSLLLSPSADGKRFLSTADIERLKMQADLVVLSACDTAAPDGSLGSAGLSGLARAFLQAGARAVVATHWRVRSDAAQAFSTSLIAGWRAGLTLSAAKAAAQRSLRQTPGFGHPGLWASFVLLGEGETKWTPGP
jgi:CHAT domain-containing protein/tetratricopeptide (TPR) repeat protein